MFLWSLLVLVLALMDTNLAKNTQQTEHQRAIEKTSTLSQTIESLRSTEAALSDQLQEISILLTLATNLPNTADVLTDFPDPSPLHVRCVPITLHQIHC